MRKILASTLCALLVLLTLNNTAVAAKMSKKQTAAFSKPFRMLTFDQIARLEFKQRVRYVREFRRIALEIEKAQFMFKDTLSADNRIMDPREKSRLYAFLFGALVDTAAAANDHTRGASPSDRCIYGYNLSEYPDDPTGVRKPHQCIIPAEARCNGANGPGVQCGYYLSGLNGSVDRACIPNAVRYKATTECDKVRNKLIGENTDKIKQAIANAEKFYKFNETDPTKRKISNSDMTGENAQQILKDLADSAYSDEAYAELLYVLSFYKKNNIEISGDVMGEQYKNIEPKLFEKNINSLQAAVNQVFADYIGHCERQLDDDEVINIRAAAKNEAQQKGTAAWILEKRRIEAVAKLDSMDKSQYRVDNVLQIPECRAIYARRDSIRDNLNEIVGSYPDVSDDAPAGEEPVPIAPPIEDNIIKPTGCSTNVVAEDEQLYQGAARCVVCLAEKNVQKTANKYSDPTEKTNREYHTTSTKWMSLISQMALACGNGVSDNTLLRTETMLEYMHTFGHCSADTYEWDREQPLSEQDKQLIKKWSHADVWTDKDFWKNMEDGKGPNANLNKDFARIYGISYANATKVFCDDNQFKTSFWGNKTRKRRDGYIQPKPEDRMPLQRTQFRNLLSGNKMKRVAILHDNNINDSVADALHSCMNESLKTAEQLYSGNGNTCTIHSPVSSISSGRNSFNAMLEETKGGGTALLFDEGHCYVAKQYERDTSKGPLRESIGFVDPKSSATSAEQYVQLNFFKDNNANTKPTVSVFPQFDQQGNRRDGRSGQGNPTTIDANRFKYYNYTLPGGSCIDPSNPGKAGSSKPQVK